MARFARDSVVTSTIETTYGTYVAPVNTTDGVLCAIPEITPIDMQMVQRPYNRPFLGGRESIPDTVYKRFVVRTEAVGAGAGNFINGNQLMRACGAAVVRETGVRVDYTPSTTLVDSVSINGFDSGVRHRGKGARGNWTLSASRGEIPIIEYNLQALQEDDAAASTPTGVTLDTSFNPQLVSDGVSFFRFGSTVSASGAVTITGGTIVGFANATFDSGLEITIPGTSGDPTIDQTARQSTLEIELDYTAAQEAAVLAGMTDATLQSFTLQHGTATGRRWILHIPQGQITAFSKVDAEGGRRRQRVTINAVAASAGTDWRFIASY